jgi:hypothetical protein
MEVHCQSIQPNQPRVLIFYLFLTLLSGGFRNVSQEIIGLLEESLTLLFVPALLI